MRLTVG